MDRSVHGIEFKKGLPFQGFDASPLRVTEGSPFLLGKGSGMDDKANQAKNISRDYSKRISLWGAIVLLYFIFLPYTKTECSSYVCAYNIGIFAGATIATALSMVKATKE